MSNHALYRFYDDGGHLLYVGITDEPGRRFAQHAAKKVWWRDVRGISIDWYDDRRSVEAAERRAIRVESPVFNVQRAAPRPATVARCWHCDNCCIFGGECQNMGGPALNEDFRCDYCDRPDCLFGMGYDAGSQDGFQIAYDRYVTRPSVRRSRADQVH